MLVGFSGLVAKSDSWLLCWLLNYLFFIVSSCDVTFLGRPLAGLVQPIVVIISCCLVLLVGARLKSLSMTRRDHSVWVVAVLGMATARVFIESGLACRNGDLFRFMCCHCVGHILCCSAIAIVVTRD